MATSFPDPETIRKWRMKAQELRAYADSAKDAAAKATYSQLAQNWEDMAARAEQIQRPDQLTKQ